MATINAPRGDFLLRDFLLTVMPLLGVLQAGCAAVAMRRPVFAIVPAAHVLSFKQLAGDALGVRISATDWIPLVDLALLICGGLAAISLLRAHGPAIARRWAARQDVARASLVFFLMAVAVHLANYFHSGLAKIVLDGGLWFWVLNNPTEVLSLHAWTYGFLPTAHWPDLTRFVVERATEARPLINALTLSAQIGVIIALWRRAHLIALTLFYDLTHIAIFLVSGIFFWKWILLNLVLVAALRRLRFARIGAPAALAMTALPIASPALFRVAKLGWYDTPAITGVRLYALDADGRRYEVPTNFFGAASVTAAQHRLGRPEPGHFPTSTWGTAYDVATFRAATDCTLSPDDGWIMRADIDRIANVVQAVDLWTRRRADGGPRPDHDLYPHHIFSNPWLFEDFKNLPPDQVVSYVYVVTSSCVMMTPDGPVSRTVRRDEHAIPLDPRAERFERQ